MYYLKKAQLVIDEANSNEELGYINAKWSFEQIPMGRTDLLAYMESVGIPSQTLMSVECANQENFANGVALVADAVDNGIKFDNKNYIEFSAGASAMRSDAYLACVDEHAQELLEWIHWSIAVDDLSAAKAMKYDSLSMSVSIPWEKAFAELPEEIRNLMVKPSIDNTAVFKDLDTKTDEIEHDDVDKDFIHRLFGAMGQKASDGAALLVLDNTAMDAWQTHKFICKYAKKICGFSMRFPGSKVMCQPILKTSVKWKCNQEGKSTATCYDGRQVNVVDQQLLLFKSGYKWSKTSSTWDEYVEGFKRLGHDFSVCVRDHGQKVGDLPYQMLSMLEPNDKELQYLINKATDKLHSYETVEGSRKLLSKEQAEAQKALSKLRCFWAQKRAKQMNYASRRRQFAGGRVPGMIRNLFAFTDVVALIEHILGVEVRGIITKGNVICSMFPVGDETVWMRSPHLDFAYAIRRIQNLPDEYRGFFLGTTVFFGIHDPVMPLLQMDFDGDHAVGSNDKVLIQCVKDTYHHYDGGDPMNSPRCLSYAAMDDGRTDDKGDAAKKALLKAMRAAPVGLYAHTITKSRAEGYNRDLIAHCTRGANLCIDAATHGEDKDAQKSKAYGYLTEYMLNKNASYKHPLPMFLAWAKGHIDPDDRVTLIPGKGHHKFFAKYTVDKYSACVLFDTADVLHVDGDDETFNPWTVIPFVTKSGKLHVVTGVLAHFEELVFKRVEDVKKVACDKVGAYEDMFREYALGQIYAWCEEHGVSFDDYADCVIGKYFQLTQTDANNSKIRGLWTVFGGIINENIASHADDLLEDGDLDIDAPTESVEDTDEEDFSEYPEDFGWTDDEEFDADCYFCD